MESESTVKNVISYQSARRDILGKITQDPSKVLDCGCNIGSLGKAIKERFPKASVVGWDYNPAAIEQAKSVLDEAKTINLDDLDAIKETLENQSLDLIIFGDVLEHLRNPWAVVEILSGRLLEGGRIIISLPNFGHWNTIWHCLCRQLPRNPRGIYDDTHLRNFMLKNLNEFEGPTLKIETISRNLRMSDASNLFRGSGFLLKLVKYIPFLRDLFSFQYLVTMRKVSYSSSRQVNSVPGV